jgi:dihydrofolate reductase
MGRKTWESIPEKFRPLDWRLNFVLTRDETYSDEWCVTWWSLNEVLEVISLNPSVENIFIIWGSHLYNQVLSDSRLEKIYLTQLEWDFDCDVFFDWVPNSFELVWSTEKQEENSIKFQFKIFRKDYYPVTI